VTTRIPFPARIASQWRYRSHIVWPNEARPEAWWCDMRNVVVISVLSFFSAIAWSCRPVCVPLSDEDVSRFSPPIEERTDRNFYVETFQLRDDQWHQCKTWLARQFFF
jgi:hypothetical protein